MSTALILRHVLDTDSEILFRDMLPDGVQGPSEHAAPRAAEAFVSNADADLIKRCLRGESVACSELFKKYYGKLMPICMRYARSSDEAKDMMQDGFTRIFSKLSSYSGKGHFIGWMKRVMLNTAINHYRASVDERSHIRLDDIAYGPALSDVEAGDLVTSSLGVNELLGLVQELPPAYRMVFNLRVVEGWSHEEIAKELGISVGTSKSNLARARMKLMQRIIEQDPSLASKRKRNEH